MSGGPAGVFHRTAHTPSLDSYNPICGSGTSRATIERPPNQSHNLTMLDRITVHGARQHNLKNIDVEIPRNTPYGDYRAERVGQILAGLRHDLRRGPAALRGDALHLRAPVSGPDGAAGRRFHRRPEPGHLDRAEDHQPQPALHRRHHHRNLRLSARCSTPRSACRTARSAATRSRARPPSRSCSTCWR